MGEQTIILPSDKSIEEAVIAALMIDEECRSEAFELEYFTENCFFDGNFRLLFNNMDSMYRSGEKIDMLTISNKIGFDRTGLTPYDLSKIVTKVGSGAHIVKHIQILYELYIRRKLVNLSLELKARALNKSNDIQESVENTQKELLNLLQFDEGSVSTIDDTINEVFEVIKQNSERKEITLGIGTGLSQYDRFCGGLYLTDLVIIAGETSQGKTSLALSIARNSALKFGTKVAFYSLEMSKVQLTARLMAQETGIGVKDIMMRQMDKGAISYVAEKTFQLSQVGIYFDERHTSNVDSIIRSMKNLNKKYGVKLFVIDYLQLVSSSLRGASREQQVGEVARALKNAAKDINVCIIALSQLSRNQSNPKPTLSRLRDSGQIEEAADVVMFTYRPEVYDKQNPRFDYPFENYDPRGAALIDIAKGRNIGLYQFIASFRADLTLFSDYAGGEIAPQERPF